jgi:hypothetical protein
VRHARAHGHDPAVHAFVAALGLGFAPPPELLAGVISAGSGLSDVHRKPPVAADDIMDWLVPFAFDWLTRVARSGVREGFALIAAIRSRPYAD